MPDETPLSVPDLPATRGAALDAALAALDGLAELGETIEDEWTYVIALADAGRTRLRTASGAEPGARLSPAAAAAVVAACIEVGRIADPHRAIDWLSTFPAVVELAIGAPPSGAPGRPALPAPAPPGHREEG